MKKQFYALIVILLAHTNNVWAKNTDQELQVLFAVNQLLHSINTNDLKLMAKVSREDGVNFISTKLENGKFSVRSVAQSKYLHPENEPQGQYFERIWEPQIILNEQIAVVWAKYDFHIDGKFSHCGVDIFNLILDNGVWKTASMTWTVQKQDCAPSPLGKIIP
ncbi:hypothetical protein L0668_19655 [Paraglaciecola aquimarina]|uniref:Nuclear transport factor 2 family protein n=1 Tax=Paraglaciecola algarum TaxID=3050085 RepID=A0ABS9DEX0_9ALTE|nr:hypothetical protein [Paraglaciecola sp. G1-23]MCF2950334.1 hypothetical protein [Paraglaciecola sp. G1-23]